MKIEREGHSPSFLLCKRRDAHKNPMVPPQDRAFFEELGWDAKKSRRGRCFFRIYWMGREKVKRKTQLFLTIARMPPTSRARDTTFFGYPGWDANKRRGGRDCRDFGGKDKRPPGRADRDSAGKCPLTEAITTRSRASVSVRRNPYNH